jgi:hypothetical protein
MPGMLFTDFAGNKQFQGKAILMLVRERVLSWGSEGIGVEKKRGGSTVSKTEDDSTGGDDVRAG